MTTRKDVIFTIFIILWFIVGFSIFFYIGADKYVLSGLPIVVNLIFISILGIAVLFKNFTNFGIWLEERI